MQLRVFLEKKVGHFGLGKKKNRILKNTKPKHFPEHKHLHLFLSKC